MRRTLRTPESALRRLRAVGRGLALLLALAGVARAAAPLCPPLQPSAGRHWAATADCCSRLSPALACSQVSPALQGGRRNAIVVVEDDFGHCMSGFMGGRCARRGTRCMGKTCSTARWLPCGTSADCPPSSSPSGCNGSGAECDAPNPGECPGGMPCAHGYCRQCVADADCAPDICVDGLCSPRASCDGAFECARSVGTCVGGTCLESGGPCAVSSDCNDVCVAGKCKRTPAPCGPNGDCPGDTVCTSASTPLRLNDLSCRYRRPGDNSWEYDRSISGTLGQQTVYTPFIDALAREGAIFPRSRGNGEVCVPSRGALLVGRTLRHRNAITNAQGDGQRQCSAAACSGGPNAGRPCITALDCPGGVCTGASTPIDVPLGCAVAGGIDATCPGGYCDKLHTMGWWAQSLTHVIGPTLTIAAGKIEIGSPSVTSFAVGIQNVDTNTIAHFTPDAACEAALDAGQIGDAQLAGSASVLAALGATLGSDGQQQQRFLVWYAPRLPHEGTNAPLYFQRYGADDGALFLARTSWLDAAIGGLVDQLKRTCVCGEREDASGHPTGEVAVESLWDNTVLVVVPDNAILLPGAKFGKGGVENAHRDALIVDAPGPRRLGGTPPVVLDEMSQFSGHQDVLPTVLDYAGLGATADLFDRYPYNASLRRFIERGNAAGFVRPVFYGHPFGTFGAVSDQAMAYLVPTPGALGLCAAGTGATTASGHVRPCFGDTDCGVCATPPCCRKGTRRCLNRPGILCADDAACAVGGCTAAHTCQSDFGDFIGLACTGDRDCVPRGACRPPMLKVYEEGSPRQIGAVYDLNRDPDQTTDLRQSDPLYLGALGSSCPPPANASLAHLLECCFREFWALDPDRVWRPRDQGCPAALRAWTTVPPGAP